MDATGKDRRRDAIIGCLLGVNAATVMAVEWGAPSGFAWIAGLATMAALGLLTTRVRWSRRIFVAIGGLLLFVALVTRPDWPELTRPAFRSACFIAAFFTVLATIRSAAQTSPSIQKCGRFLAEQPPGRRYLALTVGGQLFGLLLMYGAISLLGSLAEASAAQEPNQEIRRHRIRRMLLAIQRGFISTLTWSPLGFAMAISTTLVPGASWADAVWPCLVSGLILAGGGWALDSIFKPRLSVPPAPRAAPEGGWEALTPLLALLTILVVCVGVLTLTTGVRVVGVVMLVAPVIAYAWIAAQGAEAGDGVALTRRVRDRFTTFLTQELPRYGPELALLIMAGFIGSLGASLTVPVVSHLGLDLESIPVSALLLGMFWLILATGQLGMNPILAVSLIAPLLPAPQVMGISPSVMILAITSGWALTGATSPYTASTLMVSGFGGVSAHHVGLVWNGVYALVCGVALCLWILAASVIL